MVRGTIVLVVAKGLFPVQESKREEISVPNAKRSFINPADLLVGSGIASDKTRTCKEFWFFVFCANLIPDKGLLKRRRV